MTRKRPPRREGLDELLGQTADLVKAPVMEQTLPVDRLQSGTAQPRRAFGDAGLESLAASIRAQGILQPLLVRPVQGGYEIVAGERRWRAAQLVGLAEVPVIIRHLDDQQARVAALLENLQRENLNTVDEVDAKLDLVASVLNLPREAARARLMQLLREEPGQDHTTLEAVFTALGETWQSFTKNKLRILKWPPVVLEAVRMGLPFTLGVMIVGAPGEHHAALIALAQAGASRLEIQKEIRRLSRGQEETHMPDALRVARVLGSARFLNNLQPAARKAVDRWLAKMPDAVREALGD
ncbi:ParB/RepB/Spo0J family partition protein [Deinococcus sp. SDU3-2]|uniref:ParB/RepB/Spo0J family partition protein n=1 Tax=Deinococcus terrestris TaxID=2651870 RepID=A0A7X1TSE0_9DEIO|nr:ParB/RepB/Spo0J family partition protein [Deinococcus terrestris]MPY67720.1 ParB/RepB/Spo0J family partition protein [Deinococcus terrestris]